MKYELDLQDARAEGIEIGRSEGLEEGLEKGLEKGLEEGLEEGLEKGLEKGHSEGRNETLLLIIENGVKQGLTPEQTAALTGLTVDEVEALRKRVR